MKAGVWLTLIGLSVASNVWAGDAPQLTDVPPKPTPRVKWNLAPSDAILRPPLVAKLTKNELYSYFIMNQERLFPGSPALKAAPSRSGSLTSLLSIKSSKDSSPGLEWINKNKVDEKGWTKLFPLLAAAKNSTAEMEQYLQEYSTNLSDGNLAGFYEPYMEYMVDNLQPYIPGLEKEKLASILENDGRVIFLYHLVPQIMADYINRGHHGDILDFIKKVQEWMETDPSTTDKLYFAAAMLSVKQNSRPAIFLNRGLENRMTAKVKKDVETCRGEILSMRGLQKKFLSKSKSSTCDFSEYNYNVDLVKWDDSENVWLLPALK